MRDLTTVDERIFDFAYELAMRDATMRTAFTGTTIYALLGKRNPSTKCDATSEQKENASRAKNAVWRYIEGIRTNEGYKDKDEHDAIFLRTAKKVIDAFKGYRDGSSSFTFGNAQKLINMTAKYIALGFYPSNVAYSKLKYRAHSFLSLGSNEVGFSPKSLAAHARRDASHPTPVSPRLALGLLAVSS